MDSTHNNRTARYAVCTAAIGANTPRVRWQTRLRTLRVQDCFDLRGAQCHRVPSPDRIFKFVHLIHHPPPFPRLFSLSFIQVCWHTPACLGPHVCADLHLTVQHVLDWEVAIVPDTAISRLHARKHTHTYTHARSQPRTGEGSETLRGRGAIVVILPYKLQKWSTTPDSASFRNIEPFSAAPAIV